MAPPPAGEVFEGVNIRELAISGGYVREDGKYYSLLRDVCINAARIQISRTNTADMRIIQSVEALDDIDEAVNALCERLSEWYGLHFPELGLSAEKLARFVMENGSRSNISSDDPFHDLAISSMGADLSDMDERMVRRFSGDICSLYDTRHEIEAYIVESMESAAPNLTDIAGALLGARLLSMAGGLEAMSRLPSSTVQVMGASRALFKHLRSRAPSPKHGVIFNHPLVKGSPWWLRGKMARTLAARITLATRTDVYSGALNPAIKEGLEKKVAFIRSSHPSPPASKARVSNKKTNKKRYRRSAR